MRLKTDPRTAAIATSSHQASPRRYIGSLDGLRGVAICLVFLHHYYPRQAWNPLSVLASLGWVGVDLFFVLSGYLITGILYDTVGEPGSLQKFFARRSLRLFPVYTVLVVGVVVFASPLQVPLGWRDVPFFAYAANISQALHVVPSFGPYLRFRHLWSLAVEEQFYLLWGPLVLFTGRRRPIVATCIAGILLAALLRGILVPFVDPLTIYQGLPTRMDSILCGALLSFAVRKAQGKKWLTERRLQWGFVAGLAVLAVCCVLSRSLFNQRPLTMVAGYLGNDLWCTSLLALALIDGSAVSRWMNTRTLRFLGRYSYGFYLWHELPGPLFDRFLAAAQARFHPQWLSGTLASLVVFGVCLLVAMLSYHAIERPCLRLKRYFAYRSNTTPAVLPKAEAGT